MLLAGICQFETSASGLDVNNQPDKAYLFAYSKNEGRSGLYLAWSIDKKTWHGIGPEHRFLFSDFGRWGGQKRMFDPYLIKDAENTWHCVWSLNDTIQQFAHASSKNLIDWKSQVYPVVMKSGNILRPEISQKGDDYLITWESDQGSEVGVYQSSGAEITSFMTGEKSSEAQRINDRVEVEINDEKFSGKVNEVSWELIESLNKQMEWERFHHSEREERMVDDPQRFAGLEPVEATITLRPEGKMQISDLLIGIFFEDISYAADGGLYAELVQNRDFEYHPMDKKGRDPNWNSTFAWAYSGEDLKVETENPIHPNNKNYVVIEGGETLGNAGFDGIVVEKGSKYDFSVFARSVDEKDAGMLVRLVSEEGSNLGQVKLEGIGDEWNQYTATFKAKGMAKMAKLELISQEEAKLAVDMISLFPQETFMGRKNGLRKDLAQSIADLNPRFVRFPGGCVAHGDGIDNIYNWKNSIGPLHERKPMRNIWNYHQTLGLGYFEYFQFCDDINAEPIPVLAAGVPCQNSGTGGHGQQCGIPMEDMDDYVHDVLDLIEYANGDKGTEWGSKRAAAGHPEPFNMKYIGIGNEDLITDVFEERYRLIIDAVREKYPEITVIGTVGPFYRGADYVEGWKLARDMDLAMVDEHYYNPPGWFINNQDFYDKYSRTGSKVYLGEYAAHLPGRPNNIETALAEALYLTAVERNGDIVEMTSYAPLLAKDGHVNWNPDLIYFDNTEVKPTTGYYVQKLYGQNSGNQYLPTSVALSNSREEVRERVGVSVVVDDETGDVIIKLVNLLPIEVNGKLDLSALGFAPTKAILNVLKGKPTDLQVAPAESTIEVSPDMDYTMPAYSFSVIRFGLGKQ